MKKLVEHLPEGEPRDTLVRDLIREAEPLPFAVECFRWLRRSQDEAGSEQVGSMETEQELGQYLVSRIRTAAAQEPPYVAYADTSHTLLWVWDTYGTPGEVPAYLKGRFAADASETIKFLITYVSTSMEIETGLIRKSDFERQAYDGIARLIDPEILFTHLTNLYRLPSQVDKSVFYTDGPFEEQLAQQFAYIHQRVKATSPTSPDTVA